MTELSQQILEIIAVNPNVLAKNIAIKCSTSEVLINRYLYGSLKAKVVATPCYQWSIRIIEEQLILEESYRKRYLKKASNNKPLIKKIKGNKPFKSKIIKHEPFHIDQLKQLITKQYISYLKRVKHFENFVDKVKSKPNCALIGSRGIERFGFEPCSNEDFLKFLNDSVSYYKEWMKELGLSIED